MVKTLEFCFCLFCLCSSFLLKGVNLVCEEKVITLWFLYIYRVKKKRKNLGKTWFLHFCQGFNYLITLSLEKRKYCFGKSRDSLG